MNRRARMIAGIVLIVILSGVVFATRTEKQEEGVVVEREREIQTTLAAYEDQLRTMGRALELERQQRVQLAAHVEDLRRELDRLTEQSAVDPAKTDVDAEAEDAAESAAREPDDEGRSGFDAEALVAAGFSADTVRSYKERMDQLELERLYLRDLAAREGWLDTPRFREESRNLTFAAQEARQEFGDDFYDWMLYTSGHPNRVRVGEVMDGSAAAEVGLQPGDVIVRYDEQRIFSPMELREATTDGTAGELTAVAVLRNGMETRVYVPRGPLGIRIEYATEEPPPVS